MRTRLLNEQTCLGHCHAGHTHARGRRLGRRQFVRQAVGATGLAITSNLWLPALARAAEANGADPKPIPGGIQPFGPGSELFHVYGTTRGQEPATITDFNGMVGLADIDGTGVGTDTKTGATSKLVFGSDMRFMAGTYVGVDGKQHQGTYALI